MRMFFVPLRLALGASALAASSAAVMAQSPDFWQAESFWNGPGTFSGPPTIRYVSPDKGVRINAGIGVMYVEGNEKVMNGDYTVSHLIWQSTAPVLRGGMDVDFGGGLSASAEGSLAGFGSSYMEDYDWLKGDDSFDNWSDRSQHPDTSLDHYVSGAATLAYALVDDGNAVIRAHGGFKYTDVQWTAYGGTYVYSTNSGFRDNPGSIPDGVAGATYRQQLPELFVGVDGEEHYGNVSVGGLLRGGVTFLAVTTDDHYLRDLRFIDSLWIAPTFTAGLDVGFALGRNAQLTLAARYDHIFEQRGNTREYDTTTGALTGDFIGSAAGALRSAEITAGLKGAF